jgi:hypothetical protein
MTTEFSEMGFRINPTIQAEIAKRLSVLEKMHEQSFWTKEMEAIEVALQNELNDLFAARDAYDAYFN